MFSRFIIWQNPSLNIKSEANEENVFRVSGECLDIRFGLRGYGFKRVGEENRVIHHFGNYKCYLRKVGDPNYRLFANAVVERSTQSDVDVYKDISVSTGVLEFAEYEIKIEAARLRELKEWGGGVVEGIDDDDQFWFNLSARQIRPNLLRTEDGIEVSEFAYLGLDPLPLLVIDPNPIFKDPIQVFDWLQNIQLEHNIEEYEDFVVTDVLTIEYNYDLQFSDDVPITEFVDAYPTTLPMLLGQQIFITENFSGRIPGYNWGQDSITVSEFFFGNIYGTFQVNDEIDINEAVTLNKPFFRQVSDTIFRSEFVDVDIVGTIQDIVDVVSVYESFSINIFGSTAVLYDEISINENIQLIFAGTVNVFESINKTEVVTVNVHGVFSVLEFIGVLEDVALRHEFSFVAIENIAVVDVGVTNLPVIYAIENIHPAENLVISVQHTFSVSDTITVADVPDVQLPFTSAFDNITVDEFVDLFFPFQIFRAEIISVVESATLSIPYVISVFDPISVAEYRQIEQPIISVFDNVNVTESVTAIPGYTIFAIQNIAVTEFRNVLLPGISVFDAITVLEFRKIECLSPAVSDNITVTENYSSILVWLADVFDAVGVVEDLLIQFQRDISVFDNVSVIEFVQVVNPAISVFDNVSVVEVVTVTNPAASVFDNITITENVSVGPDRTVSVFDDITIVEFAELSLGIGVFDVIDIDEDVTTAIAPQEVNEDDDAFVNGALVDSVSVTDFTDLFIFEFIDTSVFDEIFIVEAVTTEVTIAVDTVDEGFVGGALFEAITVSEFMNVEII